MKNKVISGLSIISFALLLIFAAAGSASAAATIVIVNGDPAGVGFNDATVVAPVGGNPGTTLGQQRLNAFQAAANKWGATVTAVPTIRILATWEALTCTATGAVLGSAGATEVFRDFTGAPFTGSWYGKAETASIFGADPDPATADIRARFNVNLGNAGCLPGIFFYLGLDNNHGANVDLVTVLTHEFAHGLGFQTFTNGQTGAFLASFPSIADRFLLDDTTGKNWFSMTNAERASSSIKFRKLTWNGPTVQSNLPAALQTGVPDARINSPASVAGDYEVGTATFGSQLTTGGVTGDLKIPTDATNNLGCNPIPESFAGKIAFLDRGVCVFNIKVANAQTAGAVGVIIADNAPGDAVGLGGTDPTITIPSVRVSQADGNALRTAITSGTVNATLLADATRRLGGDRFGKALMYSPSIFVSGSSISHWDTAEFPNQLMEPAINGDLTHEVTIPQDLTNSMLTDIGWGGTAPISTALAKTSGDGQFPGINTTFLLPLVATSTPATAGLTVTWTVVPGAGGQGASFPSTGGAAAVSVTNASGIATAPPLLANGISGQYAINATIPGAATQTFAAFNVSPSAAGVSVSGRVMTSDGRGLRNARVVLTDSHGLARTVTTSSFGAYQFDDVAAGETYVIGVVSKLYRFSSQLVTVEDTLTNVNFIGQE